MTKNELIETFDKNHKEFFEYIVSLSETEFITSKNGKWTPGQQLEHVYLCLKPLSQAVNSKTFIEQKFGAIKRQIWDYDELIDRYKVELENGGKAPEKFVPAQVQISQKDDLLSSANEILKAIADSLNKYTEDELNSLVLPHPLLGALTIKEMFYLMTFHATHHLNQTKNNLQL